eukprot:NODE_249_length_12946_cov_0.357438.p1 type:complete len:416 gc:universal NODE_249_length_12946_cov_0.357438:3917-5164(+)
MGSLELVLICVGTPIQILALTIFTINSQTQQLKNRVPDLSIAAGIFSIIQFVIALNLGTNQSLCDLAYWTAHLYIPLCSLPLILRSWTVYFAWHFNEAKMCRAMKLETKEKLNHLFFFKPSYEWFLQHPSMSHRKFRYLIMAIFFLFHTLLGLAFNYSRSDNCYVFDDLIHLETIFMVYFIVNFFMIKLLFTVSMSLGIFKELLFSTLCWAFCHTFYFVLRYIGSDWADLVIALLVFLLNFISFGLPLYELATTNLNLRRQSITLEIGDEEIKKPRARQNTKYFNNNIPLKDCLKDPNGMKDFKEFLAKEFSVENILFWEKVEEFKNMFAASTIREREFLAAVILDEYVAEYAPSPINVDYKSIKLLREDIRNKNLFAEMFDKPQQSLYQLMATDSYRRFLLTPAGKRYRFFTVQ